MERNRLLFSHPVNLYGTELQAFLLAKAAEAFPEWEIENPDQPHHQEGYERFKRERGRGMLYYFEEVIPLMGGSIFLPFRDGMIGKGVFGEAKRILERTGKAWEANTRGFFRPVGILPEARCLSVEATRERIRHPDGTSKPY